MMDAPGRQTERRFPRRHEPAPHAPHAPPASRAGRPAGDREARFPDQEAPPPPCPFSRTTTSAGPRSAAAEVGGRQALAGAGSQGAVARIHAPAAGRALLRRTLGRARARPPPRPAQRRQPAPRPTSTGICSAGSPSRSRCETRATNLYYRHRARVQPARDDRAGPQQPQGGGAVLLPSTAPGSTDCAASIAAGGSTCRSGATPRSPTSTTSGPYAEPLARLDLHRHRFRVHRGVAEGLHLCRPALRRPVPRLCERRLRLGRAGASRGVARPPPRPGGGVQPRRRPES